MGLKNADKAEVNISISCLPLIQHFSAKSIKVKTSSYIRPHPDSFAADAKICGYYINSLMAIKEIKDTQYDEALLLDYNGCVAEGPGQNIFAVKNSILHTPKKGSILPGITRDTVFQIANSLKMEIQESDLLPSDLMQAEELFFTGTSVEIAPICSLDDILIGTGEPGLITKTLAKAYYDVVHGENQKFLHLLSFID
jgi:branched-chain amino acid aminotransferase